jgi:hypothetical protein
VFAAEVTAETFSGGVDLLVKFRGAIGGPPFAWEGVTPDERGLFFS